MTQHNYNDSLDAQIERATEQLRKWINRPWLSAGGVYKRKLIMILETLTAARDFVASVTPTDSTVAEALDKLEGITQFCINEYHLESELPMKGVWQMRQADCKTICQTILSLVRENKFLFECVDSAIKDREYFENRLKKFVLTGFEDMHGNPIQEGDMVRYSQEDHEELYTVTWDGKRFLLVSHEDYEYNAELGQVCPIEIVDKENPHAVTLDVYEDVVENLEILMNFPDSTINKTTICNLLFEKLETIRQTILSLAGENKELKTALSRKQTEVERLTGELHERIREIIRLNKENHDAEQK